MFRARHTLLCSLLALAACAPDDSGVGDTSPDTSTDTAADTGGDTGGDTGAETAEDTDADTAADTAVEETTDATPDDTAVPDTANDTEVADTTADTAPDTAEPPVRTCLSWLECDSGQGCAEGLCGGCTSGADCPDLLGCTADATCGSCATDSECRTGEGCSEGVCLATTISEVRITVDPADYRTLRADRYNEDLNVPCSVSADGVSYAGPTTLAVHGGSSRDLPKLSFAVETASDEHPGYAEKMVLRAEYNDASSLRNILGLELFRRSTDLPTPRTRFRRLYINGALFGLMVEVERVGSDFLEIRGRDTRASMYESEPANEIASTGPGALVPLDDPAIYRQAYDQKTGSVAGVADVVYLIEQVLAPDYYEGQLSGNFLARTRRQIHLDGYVSYLANNALLQNQDHVRKNFYFSRQTVGGRLAWEFYPWDLDLTQGCLWNDVTGTSFCGAPVYNDPPDVGRIGPDSGLTYPTDGFYNLLMHNVQSDEFGGAEAYRAEICARSTSLLYTDEIPTLARTLGAYIRPALVEDSADRNGTAEDHVAAVDEVVGFYAERAAFLMTELGCP
jgi:hypothetical protein